LVIVFSQKVNAPHHLRATQIAVADSPDGPFKVHGPKMQPPEDYMTLDGTLFVENGVPWMVYAHEWIQVLDGTIAIFSAVEGVEPQSETVWHQADKYRVRR
jgi:hypothetical protein